MSAASIISSIVSGGTNNHATVSEEANAYATDFVAQGVLGSITNTAGAAPSTGSFAVNADASPDMGVTIKGSGNTQNGQAIAYVLGQPTSQGTQVIRARMTSDYTGYTINANSSGSTKYDWIYLSFSATNAANPDSAADNVVTLFTSRSSSSSSDTGSPPTYGILLAVVTVVNGASSITNGNISDRRTQVTLNIGSATNTNGWNTLTYPLSYSANNGNKEFTVTSANNLTGILSAGMKVSVARSVTPPTQSMAFTAASSMYASKSSPSGISFTSAFTCEAWVYLKSYTGSSEFIIEHENGTSGWGFNLTATGNVNIYYGASSSFTNFTSFQSVPLNQWVHIAGAVTSVSSKTAVIYINGLSVPLSVSGSATTLVQPSSTNLQVGAYNTPNQYFDGYMSEVRVWSVAQSSSSIQSNMAISLTGSETNLVSLFQGNGNFNDATTNANNLTAQNGALATNASNPYNATEYAFVTKVSYSSPTTTVTLKAVGGTIPNMTLNSPQYSNVDMPFGWPSVSTSLYGHRLLELIYQSQQTTTATSITAFGGLYGLANLNFTVPSNCGKIKIKIFHTDLTSGSGNTLVMSFWNNLTELAQINQTTANGFASAEVLVPVISGSTVQFSIGWLTTAGTATWGSLGSGNTEQQGVSVEAA